jgi:hypothetical protein
MPRKEVEVVCWPERERERERERKREREKRKRKKSARERIPYPQLPSALLKAQGAP